MILNKIIFNHLISELIHKHYNKIVTIKSRIWILENQLFIFLLRPFVYKQIHYLNTVTNNDIQI